VRHIKKILYSGICSILLIFLCLRSTLFKDDLFNTIYYVLIAILNSYIFYLIILNKTKVNVKLFFLILVCLFSLAFNYSIGYINPVLSSWQRFITFFLAIVLIGPLFLNKEVKLFRFVLFKITIIIVILFFFINWAIVIRMDTINFEGYNGILESQILLGSLAALSMIAFLIFFLRATNSKLKILYISLFFLSFPVLLLSASRSAILSLVFVLIMFFILNIRKSAPVFSFLILVSFIFYEQLNVYSQVLIDKVEKRNDSGDITAGRAGIYSDNLLDFKSNPVVGAGFYNVINSKNSKINEDGSLEYSSGWLFILSSTGLLGFMFFLHLIYIVFKMAFSSKKYFMNDYEIIAVYFMVFFIIHSNFEGYIYSAGGLLFFIFWLSFSIVSSIRYNEDSSNFIRG
jgi:hypothetical protein